MRSRLDNHRLSCDNHRQSCLPRSAPGKEGVDEDGGKRRLLFLCLNPNQSVTAFRSEMGQKNLAGLSKNLRQIQGSTTTDAQYQPIPESAGAISETSWRPNNAALTILPQSMAALPSAVFRIAFEVLGAVVLGSNALAPFSCRTQGGL